MGVFFVLYTFFCYHKDMIDKQKHKVRSRKWAENNREKTRISGLRYYYANRELILEKQRLKRAESPNYIRRPKTSVSTLLPNKDYKPEILEHYGKECVCCGENHPRLMTVDHINNDGHKTTNSTGNNRLKGQNLYKYLILNNFPDDIQILCFNCNIGKRNNGGTCPHNSETS